MKRRTLTHQFLTMSTTTLKNPPPTRTLLQAFSPEEEQAFDVWLSQLDIITPNVEVPLEPAFEHAFAVSSLCDIEAVQHGAYESIDGLTWDKFFLSPQTSPPCFNIPNTYAEGAKLLEDCATTVYLLSRSRTLTDALVVLGSFVSSVTGKSLVHSALTSDVFKQFQDMFADLHPQDSTWVSQLSELRNALTKFEMVRNSTVFKKVHKLLMYVLSFGIFDKMGVTFDKLRYSRLEREAIAKEHTSTTNFLVCMLDTVLFILERGVTYMRTGRWTSMLHSGDKYEEWFDKATRVKEHAALLNDPDVHGFDEPEFVRDLMDVLEVGNAIYEEAKTMSLAERRFVGKLLSEIRMVRATFLNSVQARKSRDVPYSMAVVGASSIGKSNIVSLLFSMYAKWRDLPQGEEYVYTLMPDDEFWSGFKTYMWGLNLDDMGALKPCLAEAGLDKMLMQLISIVNTVPLVTNQAALEDKGTVPFRGRCVIATANTRHMNMQFVYTYPIAALRRLPVVIEPVLKPEFDRNGMLDQDRASASGLAVPDFYWFTVSRVGPATINGRIDANTCSYTTVVHDGKPLERVGLVELLLYLRADIERHHRNQDHVRGERAKYIGMDLCECHALPISLCMAEQVGARDEFELLFAAPGEPDTVPPEHVATAPVAQQAAAMYVPATPIQNVPFTGPRYGRLFSYISAARVAVHVNEGIMWASAAPHFGEPDPMFLAWRRLLPTACLMWFISAPWTCVYLALTCVYKLRVPCQHSWYVLLMSFARAYNALTNSFFDAGLLPLVDFVTVQIVRPDTKMRRIFAWSVAPAVAFVFNQCFWLFMIGGMMRGRQWCSMIMRPLLGCMPAFMFVYLAPMLGVSLLSANRVGAILRTLGGRETMAFIGCRILLSTIASMAALRVALIVGTKVSEMVFRQSGAFDDDAVTPVPHEADNTRANVWQKEDYLVTPNDVGKKACGAKSMSDDEFVAHINRNLVYVESSAPRETKRVFFRALGLTDTVYITNAHNLRHRDQPGWKLTLVWTEQCEQVTSNCECELDASMVHDMDNDLALFRIPVRPPVRNIMEFIPSRTLRGEWSGFRALRQETGAMSVERRTCFKRNNVGQWASRGDVSHEGYCGAVYVVHTPYGPQIVAIHYLGSPFSGETRSTALVREDIEVALSAFCPLHVQGQGHAYEVGDLARKSAVRFIEKGHLDVYGSVPSFSANKSRVVLSSTARFFMERGYVLGHGKPVLRGWEPQRRALLGVVEPKVCAPMALITLAVDDYVAQVLDETPSQDLSVIHMVDERTAILGMAGIPHMERLAMSTSAGYPFNKVKRECISESGEIIDDAVRQEVDRIKACYARGERAYPIFNACYKDEPTAFKKIAMNKTRVFLISNLAFTIVCRQLLMGHIRFFTSHRFQSEMAIGINCYSEEWGELREYLTHFGEDGCDDGDFAGFDSSQGAPWLMGAFDIVTELARHAGASDQYLRMLQCLKYDLVFAVVNWFGTLIQFTKQNPSGNSFTTQLNCLVISILMRCVFFTLQIEQGKQTTRFRESVRLIGYGDDSCQNVTPSARPFYNHIAIARVLSEFGYTFTMAQKEADAVPFRHMSEIGFLKRVWRWDEDVQAWLAPLDVKSIEKSLLMCMPSRAVCEEKRATDCLSSAVREYFHHGREQFENFRALAMECAVECGLTAYVSKTTFPTYVELQAQFYIVSEHVYVRQGRVAPVQVTLPAAQTDSESLLVVQGGTCSKRMAESLSHEGDPQSRCSSMSSLDSLVPHPSTKVWVDLVDVHIRPAKTHFSEASAALKAHSRHLEDVNPLVWQDILRIERNTPCLCEICRPAARTIYGCTAERCPQCERMFAPTGECPSPTYAEHAVYWANWKREGIHSFYAEVENLRKQRQLVAQSGEADVMSVSETATSEEDTHVVAHFVDQTEGVNVEYPRLYSDVRDGEHRDIAELTHFLSRPVLIDTITWSETRTPPYQWGLYQPWYQFFNNATIKYRLNNFSAIACTLRIKIVINASPFYYGSALASYIPNSNTSIGEAQTATDAAALITLSQVPHIWIYPSAQQGGEITCPFFYETNWLPLTASATQGMGTLAINVVNQLQSANGVSGAAVTMQIWAWAEDVKLMGPTINLAVQAGRKDEYGSRPVSSVASATAHIAKNLSRVPVIGPAATAVGAVASAVGDVASLFGFTKVPVIDPPIPMVPKPFANFASTDIGTTVEKLTLDTKNDLSIDPRVGGLPDKDELALQGLLARESYLTSFTFSTTNNVDDLLFASFVKPHGMLGVAALGNAGLYPLYCPTPLQYFTSMFEFWRGPIVFRFKVVATPFHQGRIRFSYDPVGDISTNVPDYASIFNEVVDLAHTNDFEVVVPYMQAIGWCRTFQDIAPCYKSNAPLGATHTAGADNGIVTVRAVTMLTAPTSASTISIQVFVRAGEEFEVANPNFLQSGRTYLAIQSGEKSSMEMAYGDVHQIVISDQRPVNHDDLFTTNMGEKVASLRQVLQRTCQGVSNQYVGVNGTNQFASLVMYQTPFPCWYGYSATGRHTANTQSGTPATAGFNFCAVTPWHYVAACFAGMRGSMQWHFNVDTTASAVVPSHMSVTRHTNSFNVGNYNETDTLATITVNNVPNAVLDSDYAEGGALTNTRTNTGLSVLVPFYNANRWISTSPWTGDTGNSSDSSDRNNIRLRINYYPSAANPTNPRIDRYFSIGPDFTFLFFLAAAPYSVLSSVTPA